MTISKPELSVMLKTDQTEVVQLISAAMNPDEAKWARQTFDFHFSCQNLGTDSTRQFYVAKLEKVVIGVVGLHQYRWGPDENVWLSWFAVSPDYQGQGIGKWLLSEVTQLARNKGYRKMFIETYQNQTFQRAIEFYQNQGFRQVGSISRFLPDESDMLVFMLSIDDQIVMQPE